MAAKPRKPKEPASDGQAAVEPAVPTTLSAGDVLSRLEFEKSGATGGEIAAALADFLKTPRAFADGLKVSDALKALGDNPLGFEAGSITPEVFDSIGRAAGANSRSILEGMERFAAPEIDLPYSDIVPLTLGPTAEEELLDGLRQDLADLMKITAAQATNVELQAQLAGAQMGKLDELIVAMRQSSAAIRESSAITHRLERTALGVAIVATVLTVIVAIPVVADLGQWIAEYFGWIQPLR